MFLHGICDTQIAKEYFCMIVRVYSPYVYLHVSLLFTSLTYVSA